MQQNFDKSSICEISKQSIFDPSSRKSINNKQKRSKKRNLEESTKNLVKMAMNRNKANVSGLTKVSFISFFHSCFDFTEKCSIFFSFQNNLFSGKSQFLAKIVKNKSIYEKLLYYSHSAVISGFSATQILRENNFGNAF